MKIERLMMLAEEPSYKVPSNLSRKERRVWAVNRNVKMLEDALSKPSITVVTEEEVREAFAKMFRDDKLKQEGL